ncbi:MAG: RluA family pseudouridine synthase [Tessaracoccus sp.]|uniref:RluA family pseudouridine synthase n=1 Tax=Tessaracoccus sp. TaxID=1971211 RepID=UPI001ECF6B20|nr:RluA family pseudouridine synthase [Tessaracoccus sp.]MBK7821558.1 RluA family pseudouridine synthase [Tessaracoccus sp.]
MSVFLIPDALAGERVDAAAARVTGHSRSRIHELIEAGGVELGGAVVAKGSQRVAGGELLELIEAPRPTTPVPTARIADGVQLAYEDRDIVVVDKPAGVAAHPSLGWEGPSVTEHLAAAGVQVSTSGAAERQGVVQRLDVGTSGLMVVAKSELAYSVLKQAFRDRRVDKIYHALAQGHPDPFQGTIDAPIGRHPSAEWKMAIIEGGRRSVTHYATLEAHRAATLLEVNLETGRTHQIRVHLAAIGHPLAGDPLYGCDLRLAVRLGLDRQWLHAVELGFVHPTRGEYVQFASDYPEDLSQALDLVRQN